MGAGASALLPQHGAMLGLPHAGSNSPTAGHGWAQRGHSAAWQPAQRKREKQPCWHQEKGGGGQDGLQAPEQRSPCGPWTGGCAGTGHGVKKKGE